MDLGVESSVEDNGATIPKTSSSVDGNQVENNNGSLGVEEHGGGGGFSADNSPARTSTPGTRKGYGLKKWRRIRRDVVKDGTSNSDGGGLGEKRGFSTPPVNSMKPQGSPVQRSNRSETSLSSTNAIVRSVGEFSLDSELGAGFNFGAVAQSENSEDHSSKSSTAASFPKLSRDILAEVGYGQDKNRMSTSSVNNLANSRKGRGDSGKKQRGEKVKIEKENSHSSMESDLRSSNFVFVQGDNSAASNGRISGRSVKSDGESSIDAHGGDQRFDEELQALYGKPSVGKFEDLYQEDSAAGLSWAVKEENFVNHVSDQDLLVESIQNLQVAQEKIQEEVEKFKDLGTDHISTFDDSNLNGLDASIDSGIHSTSSDQFIFGETHGVPCVSETEVDSLKRKISLLESKLEQSNTMAAKAVELENYRELEADVESLCQQKIEAEVEYLVLAKTIQTSRLAAADQVTLLEGQKTLISDYARVGKKAALLNKEAQKLETVCGDIAETSQVVKLQKKAWKVTSYLLLQLIMFFLVFLGILSQLSSRYAEVVPT